MSYNIDTWKTKKLDNLVLILNDFYKSNDWSPNKPEIIDEDTNEVIIEGGAEGFEMIGILENGKIKVKKIVIDGEGSGTFYQNILMPALKNSKGKLEATQIWEGGDSITKIFVNDGLIEEVSIEI